MGPALIIFVLFALQVDGPQPDRQEMLKYVLLSLGGVTTVVGLLILVLRS
jgi:hypothetical protein